MPKRSPRYLTPVVKFMAQHGAMLVIVAVIGSAGEEIAKYAEQGQFDFIVMGARGHSPLSKLVMGSVSTKVLASCSTPVLDSICSKGCYCPPLNIPRNT